MDDNGAPRFASVAAILTGLLMVATIMSDLFYPSALTNSQPPAYYQAVLRYAAFLRLRGLATALWALFGLGVVIAVADLIRPAGRSLVRWISVLALVGFTVTAVDSLYWPAARITRARAHIDQQWTYDGYGIRLGQDDSGQPLAAPFPQSPAAQAGMEAGDVLLAINGRQLGTGTSLEEVSRLLAESPGGRVTLSVQTPGGAPRELTIAQGTVRVWNTSAQDTIEALGVTSLDPEGLFGFGLVGLWLLAVNWVAGRRRLLPPALACIGLAAGIACCLCVAGLQLGWRPLTTIGTYGGPGLGAVWSLWLGVVLWARSKAGLAVA